MNNYTNYCTQEQTKRAFKLGAPILEYFEEGTHYPQYELPTTQQMIGWLREEKFIEILISSTPSEWHFSVFNEIVPIKDFYMKEYIKAELAAIDAALDYLEKGETE